MKKKTIKSIFMLGLMVFVIVMNTAPDLLLAQDDGAGQPGAFLRLGIGVRALGLGRAYTAIANDASAAYWNPAGLGQLDMTELQGSYSILTLDRRQNYLGIAVPIKSVGTIGISWINLSVGDIQGYDLMGRQTGTFSNSENAYLVTFGAPITKDIYVGVTAKYISHILENHQSSGFGLDAGILFAITEYFKIGGMIQDISTRVKWDTDNNTKETFPVLTRAGISLKPFDYPFLLGLTYQTVQNQAGTFHLGAEVDLIYGLGFRLGYDGGRITSGGYFSVPIGSYNLQTDYSLGQDPIDRSLMHRLSILFRFSGADLFLASQKKPENLNGYLKLMSPPPTARIIKITEQYPDYALINSGAEEGMQSGLVLGVFRLEHALGMDTEQKVKIGTVRIVKVEDHLAAVKVIWMKEGYQIELGDILIYETEGSDVSGLTPDQVDSVR